MGGVRAAVRGLHPAWGMSCTRGALTWCCNSRLLTLSTVYARACATCAQVLLTSGESGNNISGTIDTYTTFNGRTQTNNAWVPGGNTNKTVLIQNLNNQGAP